MAAGEGGGTKKKSRWQISGQIWGKDEPQFLQSRVGASEPVFVDPVQSFFTNLFS